MRLTRLASRHRPAQPDAEPSPTIRDHYVRSSPSPGNAIGIFAGEWASRLPPPLDEQLAGDADLFGDARVRWAIDAIGGVAGLSVLELGPLEGGHTYTLDRAGAAEVVAVEANTRAFLKCLIAKELVGMPAAKFLCGDFTEYLQQCERRFDLVVASGVLYHMVDPIGIIARCAALADRLFVWTHYYDEPALAANGLLGRVVPPTRSTFDGYEYSLYRQDYGAAVDRPGFCGGSQPYANWLSREGLLGALDHVGLTDQSIAFESLDHPQGPAMCVLACRPASPVPAG